MGVSVLQRVFSSEVLARLEKVQRPQPSPWDDAGIPIRERHHIVQLTGPSPSPARWARRNAWDRYLRAASACRLLDDELLSRLRDRDDDLFRGAMAECLVAWFFLRRRRMEVVPRPDGSATKNVDLAIRGEGLEVATEVKAPFVPRTHSSWNGSDEDAILKSLRKAGTQCKGGRPNLVVLVPILRSHVFNQRHQLINATIGERVLIVPVSLDGSPPEPERAGFNQNGHLAKLWRQPQGPFRTVLTRVSAVLSIEEGFAHRGGNLHIGHWVVAVHNPFAAHPIPPQFFGRIPQWIVRDGMMGWSDKYRGI